MQQLISAHKIQFVFYSNANAGKWQEQTGDPRSSWQYKTSKHDVSSKSRWWNVIWVSLVHQQPATFSGRSASRCVIDVLGLLAHMSHSQLASCLNYAWKLEYWCIKYLIFILWVRSFSMTLTSVTFAEDEVLIFLILRKNAKIVQLWV